MKNLVIAAAMNYGVEQIKNFILSFRKFNKEDDIVLIYNLNQTTTIEDFCLQHNIKLVSFEPCDRLPIHVVSSRFLKYLDIVKEFDTYQNYLLSDIRDVFFQANPFVDLPETSYLYTFTEDPAITIDIEEHHIPMINRLFGESELQKFKDKKIICSGTILGTRDMMIEFLEIFAAYLTEIQKQNPSICYEMLLDQVITNHICHLNEFSNKVNVKSNGDIVGTIGHCITHPKHLGKMELKDNTIFLNDEVPAVIHQYDRSPELFQKISSVYPV